MIRRLIRRLAAHLRGRAPPVGSVLDRPLVRRSWRYTSLQFDRADAQSRMLRAQPDRLLVDYTRTMMAALLWSPTPRTIGMIGLGGGSQTKFCLRHLPQARVEVAEINPAVVALRRRFRIPADGPRLEVVIADGAAFVQARRGRFDVLLVDGYDTSGIPNALSTQQFYDDCRDALAADGVLSVNLYCADADRHIARIRHAFGADVLVSEEPRMSNRIVFAWRGAAARQARALARAAEPAPAGLSQAGRAELADVLARVARLLRRRD